MTEQAEAIELDMDAARAMIERGDALRRLTASNPDFQLLISTMYFQEEPARITTLLSHPQFSNEEGQKHLTDALKAIGGLYEFFRGVEIRADQARSAIDAGEEELALMAEEGEE